MRLLWLDVEGRGRPDWRLLVPNLRFCGFFAQTQQRIGSWFFLIWVGGERVRLVFLLDKAKREKEVAGSPARRGKVR